MTNPVKVLVIQALPVVREGIRTMLDGDDGINLVGSVSTPEAAVETMLLSAPDVVLLGWSPGLDFIRAIRAVKEARPSASLLLLSLYEDQMQKAEAFHAGAAGYLGQDTSSELLIQAIKAVAGCGAPVPGVLALSSPASLVRSLNSRDSRRGNGSSSFPLTLRERDVLLLMVDGRTNREIAGSLTIAHATVKKHVQNIIAKMGASDRTEASVKAIRSHMVQ